jgi:two-component system, cell cycle response regulator DivK
MQSEQTHILIVEDSADDRIMYAQYLSQKGYRVSKACDGKEGLEQALELQPHLILMDLWLPKISGWVAMHLLKADGRTKHIPVLVITGHSSVRTRECAGWLMKPCPLDQLDAEIARVLVARG